MKFAPMYALLIAAMATTGFAQSSGSAGSSGSSAATDQSQSQSSSTSPTSSSSSSSNRGNTSGTSGTSGQSGQSGSSAGTSGQSGSTAGTSGSTSGMSGQSATDAQQRDPHNIQASGPETWGMLQGHEKGYISKTDATPNSWLAQNFTSCDKDRDGKVTQTEYNQCDKNRQH